MTPLEALGLPDTATADEVKQRFRELASLHHPDHGGDAETFALLRKAYQSALETASAPKPCAECQGTGKLVVRHGFSSLAMVCTECGGAGCR